MRREIKVKITDPFNGREFEIDLNSLPSPYREAPETATERDRLREVNAELLQSLKETVSRYVRLEELYAKCSGITYEYQNGTVQRAEAAILAAEGGK